MKHLAGILMTLALIGCSNDDPLRQPGVIELSDAFSAEFELVDHNGQPATDKRFEGKPMLIYYGFASCPDVCPAALSTMSASLEAMGRQDEKIQALFITIDPERDTQEILKAHLAFDDRILGLTGTPENISASTKAMRVYTQKVPMPESALGYTMDHQSQFYFVDSDGEVRYAMLDSMLPGDIARLLKHLAD
ncbi:SCO family protein [Parvularcula sp. IMCC14364]|uniref:SCO family protein n=1 Tax=Parvularcula sp. IMCC14364 TaxID=3067902 RepID=UPI00274290D7|nr:SCO family protein [Parvularcula sp. IMCC14364]